MATFTRRQRDTILAALRFWRHQFHASPANPDWLALLDRTGEEPLSNEQVGVLIERVHHELPVSPYELAEVVTAKKNKKKPPKVTFKAQDPPFNQGWKGWSHYIDVLVDGVKIGELTAIDCQQKRYMEYTYKATAGEDEQNRAIIDKLHSGWPLAVAKNKVKQAVMP